jgi:sugar/nucleoside kinase (ribokinase family)
VAEVNALGVIGNVSVDITRHPDGRRFELLGGAALHLALAAAQAGLSVSPVAVIGDDLADIHGDRRLEGVNLQWVLTVPGRSCRFNLAYADGGRLASVSCDYGVAEMLTEHAMAVIAEGRPDHWHVACRRPLDTSRILPCLAAARSLFSVDFHLASAEEQIAAAAAVLAQAAVVFLNADEHRVLLRNVNPETLAAVVVSDGPREVILWHYGNPVAAVVPPQISVTEATGAGDTLAGTFLALTAQGMSDVDALTAAVNAASRHAASSGLWRSPDTERHVRGAVLPGAPPVRGT